MIRVEVVAHFNEEPFSHGVAAGLAARIRRRLADYRCPTHGDELLVRVSTQGVAQTVNDISVEVSACCDVASREVWREVEEIRSAQEDT